MTGAEILLNKQKELIDNLIQDNLDKPYLKFFNLFISKNLALTTVHEYLLTVIKFMNFCNNKELSELNLDDYISYLSTIEDKSVSYQRTVYFALKKFSFYLQASNKNSLHPMKDIKKAANRPTEQLALEEKRKSWYLSKEEIPQYINNIQNGIGTHRAIESQKRYKERDMAIITLFLSTGMRCSALNRLDIDNINFEKKEIITIEKGQKGQTYALSDKVISILKEWLKIREQILRTDSDEKALFISNQKKRMCAGNIIVIVNKYAENIKGKHITPHKLRASYATNLYNTTKDLEYVQKCMGHKHISTTELYIRMSDKELMQRKHESANIMSDIMF